MATKKRNFTKDEENLLKVFGGAVYKHAAALHKASLPPHSRIVEATALLLKEVQKDIDILNQAFRMLGVKTSLKAGIEENSPNAVSISFGSHNPLAVLVIVKEFEHSQHPVYLSDFQAAVVFPESKGTVDELNGNQVSKIFISMLYDFLPKDVQKILREERNIFPRQFPSLGEYSRPGWGG